MFHQWFMSANIDRQSVLHPAINNKMIIGYKINIIMFNQRSIDAGFNTRFVAILAVHLSLHILNQPIEQK